MPPDRTVVAVGEQCEPVDDHAGLGRSGEPSIRDNPPPPMRDYPDDATRPVAYLQWMDGADFLRGRLLVTPLLLVLAAVVAVAPAQAAPNPLRRDLDRVNSHLRIAVEFALLGLPGG